MIALDTNVLVRFITQDDPRQAAAARRLLDARDETFFASDVVLVELVWTLRRLYRYSRHEVVTVLQSLLDRTDFTVEDRQGTQQAVRDMAAGGDFADALVAAKARTQGCSHLATFDEEMAARHPDFVTRPE